MTTEIRLLQVPLEDKLKITASLCAWCYHIGYTQDRKEIYFELRHKEEIKEKYKGSHGICKICYEIVHKELKNHIDYLID